MKKLLLIMVILASVSGCATRPESISPSYVSHERYVGNECTVLRTKKSGAIANLVESSDLQNNDANNDALGVFLVGIPVSQLSGDHAAEVAKWKGTVDAIETAQIINNCEYTEYIAPVMVVVEHDLNADLD